MHARLLLGLLLIGLPFPGPGAAIARGQTSEDAPREATPVRVTVDTSEVPELAPWADEARALVEQWHPKIADLLHSDGFNPPAEVSLVFRKDMRGVAATSGTTIWIAASWVREHPDDHGMVIHELAHVIQSYPRSRSSWLIEGIADYIRFFHFEPETRLAPVVSGRDRYRDGYRTTAQFLAWIEREHDPAIVHTLNAALRRSEYTQDLFQQETSRSLDELWAEFVAGSSRGEDDD